MRFANKLEMDVTEKFRHISSGATSVSSQRNPTNVADNKQSLLSRVEKVHNSTHEALRGASALLALLTKHGPAYVSAIDELAQARIACEEDNFSSDLTSEPALHAILNSRLSIRPLAPSEKQAIEVQVQRIVSSAGSYINSIKAEIDSDANSTLPIQLREHLRGLIALIEHKIAKVRSTMQELQRRHEFVKADLFTLIQLDTNWPFWQSYYDKHPDSNSVYGNSHQLPQHQRMRSDSVEHGNVVRHRTSTRAVETSKQRKAAATAAVASQSDIAVQQDTERTAQQQQHVAFTREEVEVYENQTQQIFRTTTDLQSDLSQVSGKLHHVASLQQLFAKNVYEQEELAEFIVENVDRASNNIADANVDLIQALRKTTSFRYWITFILLVLSITLIFLDWYNY